jgi:WXG100 family type VII secretion target
MSYDEIKLDYGLAEDMVKTFRQSVEQLQDTMQEVQSIANTLDDGALRGRGGSAFVDSIRGKFSPSLTKLIEKFEELAGDVEAAIGYMKEADQTSRGMF